MCYSGNNCGQRLFYARRHAITPARYVRLRLKSYANTYDGCRYPIAHHPPILVPGVDNRRRYVQDDHYAGECFWAHEFTFFPLLPIKAIFLTIFFGGHSRITPTVFIVSVTFTPMASGQSVEIKRSLSNNGTLAMLYWSSCFSFFFTDPCQYRQHSHCRWLHFGCLALIFSTCWAKLK